MTSAVHTDELGDLSEIQFDDEGIRLVLHGLAREVYDAAPFHGVPDVPIEEKLCLVLGALGGDFDGLIEVGVVPTGNATDLWSLRVGFSNEGYRRLARTAKDRMAGSIDGNRDV